MWDSLNHFELGILDAIKNTVGCALLDFIMPLITLLGEDGIFFIALAVVMLFSKKTRKTGIMIGGALLLGFIVGNLTMKPLFARMRPYDFNEAFDKSTMLVEALSDYSFPSGHTLALFEGCTVLFLTQKKYIGIPALCTAALVAFSRLYLYVHYPSDVLVGAVLGVTFAIVSYVVVNWVYKKLGKGS